jgi:penicillin amidase
MRFLRIVGLFLLIAVIGVAATGALLFIDTTRAPLPVIDGNVRVPGLTAQVEILRDRYGTPHIYANNLYDLYFAQGMTHAQDRWWQMEFFRHTARGAIQELTGRQDHVMGTDVFLRTVGLYRAAERDYALLGEEAKAFMDAFTDGVNSYIAGRAPDDLAMEYRLLGVTGANITLEAWSSVDSLAWGKVISWLLTNTYGRELARENILETLGAEMLAAFTPPYPDDVYTPILHADDLPLTSDSAGTSITSPTGAARGAAIDVRVAGGVRAGAELESVGLLSVAADSGVGSNNWVATGGMTDDGLALFANDPHLAIAMPSIWYEIGLHCLPVSEDCPVDMLGFGFAPVPGLIAGHNAQIAWGLTNNGADVQDLYRIRVNPANPLQYEWNGAWRDMTLIETTIQFANGRPPLPLQIRETHWGPIINDNTYDADTGTLSGFNNVDPMALRWTGHDPGSLWEAIVKLNFARNWSDFRAAMRQFNIPSQNFVYADTAGNIGYQMPGSMPLRAAGHTGQTPVDGWTDAYAWQGYVPFDSLPRIYNPARDYIATANQAVTPAEYYDQLAAELGEGARNPFTPDWSYGYRGQRIENLLNELPPHTAESFMRIQTDNFNMPALAILPYLTDLFVDDPDLAAARDWLRDYDGIDTALNPHASLVNLFIAELLIQTFADQLPEGVDVTTQQVYAVQTLLSQPDHAWWDDANTPDMIETRDDILRRALARADERARAAMGADREAWVWGALHTARFVSNPLGASGIDIIEDIFNRGAYPVDGGYEVVNATSWSLQSENFEVTNFPSYRLIVDLSDLDASWSIHPTGASAHPYSPFYDNLTPLWLRGEYKPLPFTRTAVEEAAAHRLVLTPADS